MRGNVFGVSGCGLKGLKVTFSNQGSSIGKMLLHDCLGFVDAAM